MIPAIQQLFNLFKLNIPLDVFFVLQLLLGAVLLFFGQKVIRIWLALTGMLGGAYVANLVIDKFKLGQTESLVIYLLLVIAGAVILATAYKACFFIGGFIGGYYLGQYILAIFWPQASFYVVIIIAVVCAFLTLLSRKEFEIYASSITGSMLLVDAGVTYINKLQPGDLLKRVSTLNMNLSEDLIILLAICIFAATGIYLQKRKKHSRD